MQYTTLAILSVIASIVNAQGIPNIPQCSLQCFTTALTSDGCSSLTDFACHCQKQQLASQITSCVQTACSPSDQQAVLQTVQDTCRQAGHPITVSIPSTEAGGSSTAAGSSASSASAPASTSAATSTLASSPSAASPPSSEPTSVAATSAAAPSMSSMETSAAASTTPAATSSSGSATAASSASSASTFTGAAAVNNVQQVGGFGAMLLAIAAYIL